MGVHDLQRYIETHVSGACVSVDLLKIARGVTLRLPCTPARRLRPPPTVELCLVVDAEGCLDRLYGGFFSDWVCGGQWSRMVHFLSVLLQTTRANNMELAVFVDGALQLPRLAEWVAGQYERRLNVGHTLKHLAVKGTPPPKVWWQPPAGLHTVLRLALRHLRVQTLQSSESHVREVAAFCAAHGYHGVLGDSGEYLALRPARYFSARHLKLTYKGSLETREYIVHETARALDLQPARFAVLAALLGNFLLRDDELADFVGSLTQQAGVHKPTPDDIVRLTVKFVRSLPSVDNVQDVGARVFQSATDPRIAKLKRSVQYYLGVGPWGRQKSPPSAAHSGGDDDLAEDSYGDRPCSSAAATNTAATNTAATNTAATNDESLSEKLQKLVVEDNDNEDDPAPGSYNAITSPVNGLMDRRAQGPRVSLQPPPLPQVAAEVLRTALHRHRRALMSPWVHQVLTQGELKVPVSLEDDTSRCDLPCGALFYRPVRARVYAVLFNVHHHMFLSNQQQHLPQTERHQIPHVQIREWVYSRSNPYTQPDLVTAEPLGWGVPTVQRLWFGTTEDEKKRRMRVFLSCMHCDTALMTNTVHVPQHLIVLACVLRYMMTRELYGDASSSSSSSITSNANCSFTNGHGYAKAPCRGGGVSTTAAILCKPELDAFIAQALCDKRGDDQQLQQLQLPTVTARGVQLASLFMQGVEHVLFVNDACGSPVSWTACCPWLYFDGKLFHSYLLKAARCRNALELCNNQVHMANQLDLVRQAVLDGVSGSVQYARPRLGASLAPTLPPPLPPTLPPPMSHAHHPAGGRARGGVLQRGAGGRLEVGGVVVGSWAANVSPGSAGTAGVARRPVGVLSTYGGGHGGGGIGRGHLARVMPAVGRHVGGAAMTPAGVVNARHDSSPHKHKNGGKKRSQQQHSSQQRAPDAGGDGAAGVFAAPQPPQQLMPIGRGMTVEPATAATGSVVDA